MNQDKKVPEYLYKYKSCSEEKDINRILEIIEKNRIYVPKRIQLNDPLEGYILDNINFAIMGNWYYQCQNRSSVLVEDILNEYRILSLSAKCDNPVMWAHYAGNYSGVCLKFSTKGAFSKAKELEYLMKKASIDITDPDQEQLKKLIEESLLKKGDAWGYEKEYRILTKDEFMTFERKDISAVILGHKIQQDYKKQISMLCKKYDIPMYFTHISDKYYKIDIVEAEYIEKHKANDGEMITNYLMKG